MKHHFTTGNPLNLIEISKFGLVVCLVSLAGLSGCNKATDPAGAATSAAANPGGTPSGTTPSTAGGNVAGANAPGGSTPSSQATASQAGATSAPSGAPGSAPGKGPSGPSGAGAPPVSVTTVRAQQRDLAVQVQATGAVTPVSVVDVRSQVSSVVTQVHIKEGQFVQKGQPLFTLDSRSDEANVAKARAQLTKDEAALADAQRQLARSRQLVEKNFVSQGALDTAQANVDAQMAVVASDKAALDAVRVPLSYAKIMAPGSGRVGQLGVFQGSAVQANVTPMVTITQLDPITVAFAVPQKYLGDALSMLKQGGGQITVSLPEGTASASGKLSFVDANIDANSGTVKVKATFQNKEYKLWPGAFVNVAIQIQSLKDVVVIPQATIIQTARGSIVYVIDKENKAAIRPVTIVQGQGEEAAVTGVKPGERVALDGRQNLRPGSTAIERPRDGGGKAGDRSGKSGEKGPDKVSDKPSDKGSEKGLDKGADKGADKASGKADAKPPQDANNQGKAKP